MSTIANETANIRVSVATSLPDSEKIPKLIELFDKTLKVVWSRWYESNSFNINALQPGTYTLRLSLSSGLQKDETFDLHEDETKIIEINIGSNSPLDLYEWAYLNKNFRTQAFRDTNMKTVIDDEKLGKMVHGKIFNYTDGSWHQELLPQFMDQVISGNGNMFNYDTSRQLSVLEISGDDIPNFYVSLPPGNQLKCLVKLTEGFDESIHPVDVTVSTDHFKAETLLTLLTNGAIRQATSLSNAEEAEELLQEKISNPVTAAIGGYFLLKIGALERLHDWANNLANWFPWLPDGLIIHATQLLNKEEKTSADIELIRARLLKAASIGIPVYSEGLRLLDKGLTQLWYYSEKKDKEIEEARDKVGSYVEVTDFSQETTSYIGISPNEPERERPKAKVAPSTTITTQSEQNFWPYEGKGRKSNSMQPKKEKEVPKRKIQTAN